MSIFHFRVVEVKPQPSSEMMKEHPDVAGAFVDCYAVAATEGHASDVVSKALDLDGYQMIKFDEVRELYRDGDWLFEEMPAEVREIAEEALESGEVIYGAFHLWPKKPWWRFW